MTDLVCECCGDEAYFVQDEDTMEWVCYNCGHVEGEEISFEWRLKATMPTSNNDSTCTSCGREAVKFDDYIMEWVCRDCGHVDEDVVLFSDDFEDYVLSD